MLQSLTIRDVVLIHRLELVFESGLSVLTGETGAGKSILLDALGLALGLRGDSALVRKGAASASVTASFELEDDHVARTRLRTRELETDGPLILRRVLGADGRSRAFINDQPVSVGTLREIGGLLVEVHGQFDNHGLLEPATHRAALDAYGAIAGSVATTAERFRLWRAAQEEEAKLKTLAAAAEVDQDFLRHAAAELDALSPRPGEEQELAARRTMLASREKLVDALNAALSDLSAQKGVEGALRTAQRHLERIADKAMGQFDAAIAALDSAAVETAEAVSVVEKLGASLDVDTAALETAEERLFALRALARKHRVDVDNLAALREDIGQRLSQIDDREGNLQALVRATATAHAAFAVAAASLTAERRTAAARLDKSLRRELAPLKLEKAKFKTSLDPLPEEDWSADGAERVTFLVATNPGSDPGPLSKIASGGEIARLMLGLKVVLAQASSAPVLVFDEVDSGIGGAAAAAVGERLARLARDVQVLVVTHSPQVAARGHHHWRVVKRTGRNGATTEVEPLDPRARREEIARLLSGSKITDAARAAADSLIAGAQA